MKLNGDAMLLTASVASVARMTPAAVVVIGKLGFADAVLEPPIVAVPKAVTLLMSRINA
jgi:hypothetical protein